MERSGRLSIRFWRPVTIKPNYLYLNQFVSICCYATTSTDESVFIIGGWTYDSQTGRRTSIIAEYKNDQWYNAGNLNQSRHAHGGITAGSLTMIIGGSSADSQP